MKPGIESLTHILLIAALGAWIAIMVQRGIAVFHDGLRNKMGDFVSGTANRDDLVQTANRLNQLFAIWFVPLTLATGTVLSHVLLLPLDLLGIRSRKWWLAGIAGAIWGYVLSIVTMGGHILLARLPINIGAYLLQSFDPLVYGMAIIPVVAVAYQFGRFSGIFALLVVFLTYIASTLIANSNAGMTNGLTMLAGILVLFALAYHAERKRRVTEETIDMSFLETRTAQIRKNALWFAVLGALMGTSINMGLLGWYSHDTLSWSYGFQLQAILAAAMISIGFLPTVVSSEAITGVSQIVGLTFVFLVAYIAPHPIIAAVAGGLIMFLEIHFIDSINTFMYQAPTIREVGDSMRGAFDQMSSIMLIAGAFAVSGQMIPGGGGYLLTGGIIGLNEMTGTPIIRMAIGPVAVLLSGIVANILYTRGLI